MRPQGQSLPGLSMGQQGGMEWIRGVCWCILGRKLAWSLVHRACSGRSHTQELALVPATPNPLGV